MFTILGSALVWTMREVSRVNDAMTILQARIERAYGRFSRLFTLPDATDLEHISAKFEDGVLTIRIPKAEESKPRRIEIE